MGKSTSKVGKGSKESKVRVEKVAEEKEVLALKNESEDDSSSGPDSEEVSSDDDVDVQGLVEPQSTGKKAAHSVKLTKEDKDGENGSSSTAQQRAVIYVGRLPKSFQERELKKYFSQFGDITRVRVSRNKQTGASRHYAFVEFKELHPAQVAAETMNNYLLVGHLLKVHVVENPHEELFAKNMKSDFREFDWRAKEYEQQEGPKSWETWKELQEKYEESKKKKFSELKRLGFDYNIKA